MGAKQFDQLLFVASFLFSRMKNDLDATIQCPFCKEGQKHVGYFDSNFFVNVNKEPRKHECNKCNKQYYTHWTTEHLNVYVAEEVKDQVQIPQHYDGNLDRLYRYLNDEYGPKGAWVIVWTVTDILDLAWEMGYMNLRPEDCQEILDIIRRNYSKKEGINVMIVKVGIETWIESNKPAHVNLLT
jgi:hypothetical protein